MTLTAAARTRSLRVLVPLDGSPLGEAILPYVLGLEPATTALLRVVAPGSLLGAGGTDEDTRRAEAKRSLDELAGRLRAAGAREVTTEVRAGDPADAILDAAGRGPSLVALTTHGWTGFDPVVLGKVAVKTIRTCPVSVLALRATEPPKTLEARPVLDRILIPQDGSDVSFRAVEVVALVAGDRAVSAMLLGVVEMYGNPVAVPTQCDPGDLATRYLQLRCEGARAVCTRAAARARDLGLDAIADIDVGRPAARILDRAQAGGFSLIAMATHGRSGLTRWALGSVTEQVLEASPLPVLVCR